MTCTNAKAAGIVIYTVQVNTGGDPTSTVLKNCASDTDKFSEIKSANQTGEHVQHDRHRPVEPAHRSVTSVSQQVGTAALWRRRFALRLM